MFCKGIHTIWYLVVYIKQVDPEIIQFNNKIEVCFEVLGYQITVDLAK